MNAQNLELCCMISPWASCACGWQLCDTHWFAFAQPGKHTKRDKISFEHQNDRMCNGREIRFDDDKDMFRTGELVLKEGNQNRTWTFAD
jgi:hypothetical protein